MRVAKAIKRGAIVSVCLASLVFVGVGATWAVERYQARQPSAKNFERAIAALVDKNRSDDGHMNYVGFRSKYPELCVPVPIYPEPDARSKVRYPLAWHMDFREGESNAARSSQLKQLDALAGVGLLSRVVLAEAGDAAKHVARYRLTSKGWAASNWKSQSPCLVFGYQHGVVVSQFERKQLAGLPKGEWYEVVGTMGAGPLEDLAEWARSTEVRSAFPEIAQQLAGVPFRMLFTWDGKQWVEARAFPQRQNTPQGEVGVDINQQSSVDEAAKRERDQLRMLKPPTLEEVKSILNATYGAQQKTRSSLGCIALPQAGDSRLPVDKELTPWTSTGGYGRYAVAVFTNKTRPGYDRVLTRTLPYLETLQSLGVITKRSLQGVSGTGTETNRQFDADVYELAPAYAMDTELSHCLPLGKPTVEFVAVELSEQDYFGMPQSFVRYKLRIRYMEPPSWVKEPQVAGWDEVQSALGHGRACEGNFQFDRRERILVGGAGSCWWAFDSYAEND